MVCESDSEASPEYNDATMKTPWQPCQPVQARMQTNLTGPPVYRPCPPREAIQAKPKAGSVAPPIYNPCPSREAVQAKMGALVVQPMRKNKSSVSEEQLTIAQHNWINVICQYGDSRNEIETYAIDSGYNTETAGDAIIRAIESTRWNNRKIAHGKGGGGSNVRGGTNEEIEQCKEAIKAWFDENRGPNFTSSKKGKKGKGQKNRNNNNNNNNDDDDGV
jgi:hypothetical protein